MRIDRLIISNLRNLPEVDVTLSPGAVIVGENRSGKSNMLFAVRLVLDPTLLPHQRVLDSGDFSDSLNPGTPGWDPMRAGEVISVSVELSDLESQPATLAALGDALIEGEPMRARLTYRFAPDEDVEEGETPTYGWSIYGGEDGEEVRWDIRKFLAHVHLPALRDAEGQLASWRGSPLKPLLEAAAEASDPDELEEVSKVVEEASQKVGELVEIQDLGNRISERTKSLVGERQALETALEIAPADPMRLIRSLRLLVDGTAQRPLSAASLGALNVLYLALLDLGLDRQLEKDEAAHVVLTIEEPEAHLHPHVQRALFESLLRGEHATGRTVLVSTHSPHIVSAGDPRDLVVMNGGDGEYTAHSAADAALTEEEWNDLQRYLDATRSEMVFGSQVMLVEGFAELVMVPRFAAALGIELDRAGITISAIHGTHFGSYARFLDALKIPWVAITDGDRDVPYTGADRVQALLERLEREGDDPEEVGIFLGGSTLEQDVYEVSAANRETCLRAVPTELIPHGDTQAITSALQGGEEMPSADFMAIVRKVGKGRFAQRLSAVDGDLHPPQYVRSALERIDT